MALIAQQSPRTSNLCFRLIVVRLNTACTSFTNMLAFRPGARARVRAPASVPISPRVPRQRSMFTLAPPTPCAIELPAGACRHACIRTRVDVCLHTQTSGACAHANAHALRAQISRHTKRACVHPRCLASPALPHRVPCVRVCVTECRDVGMQPAA